MATIKQEKRGRSPANPSEDAARYSPAKLRGKALTPSAGTKAESSSSRSGKRTISRDSETGRFVGHKSGSHAVPSIQRPDAFLDEFTSHPVVDEVMQRLSK